MKYLLLSLLSIAAVGVGCDYDPNAAALVAEKRCLARGGKFNWSDSDCDAPSDHYIYRGKGMITIDGKVKGECTFDGCRFRIEANDVLSPTSTLGIPFEENFCGK